MLEITNFTHDSIKNIVSFDVENYGEKNNVKIEATNYGCTSTRIDGFSKSWPQDEYDQLDEFQTGCTNLVHRFNHYENEWD